MMPGLMVLMRAPRLPQRTGEDEEGVAFPTEAVTLRAVVRTRGPCCAVSVSSRLWGLSRAEATTMTGMGGYLDRGARRTRAMSQKGAGRTDRLRQEHNSKKAGLYGSRNATARMKPAEPFSML
jgi:hypothetical protein